MLLGLRPLYEDFPVTSSYPNTLFVAAPYGTAAAGDGFVNGGTWAGHDSDTGLVVGGSAQRPLSHLTGIPVPTVGALQNGRASAFFVSSASEILNPATLPLSGWFVDYPGAAPWPGKASAGTSGVHQLNTQATDPIAGTLNGHNYANFEGVGTNDCLVSADDLGAYTGDSNSWSGVVLFNTQGSVGTGPPVGQPYFGVSFLVNQDGIWGFSHTTNGVQAWSYDAVHGSGGYVVATAAADPGVGSWHLLEAYCDGTDVYARMDSGLWVNAGAPVSAGWGGEVTTFKHAIGAAYNFGTLYQGFIAEMMFSASVLTRQNFDDIKTYINARYALSL